MQKVEIPFNFPRIYLHFSNPITWSNPCFLVVVVVLLLVKTPLIATRLPIVLCFFFVRFGAFTLLTLLEPFCVILLSDIAI